MNSAKIMLPSLIHLLLCALVPTLAHSQHLSSQDVLILYNSNNPESKKLAEFYQTQRNIPENQSLGLELSDVPNSDISRSDYETKILRPLRDHFDNNQWWQRSRNGENLLLPVKNKIRAIVIMRGVPHRIFSDPGSKKESDPKDPTASRDEASLDSELSLFGIETLPTHSILKNNFYDSKKTLSESNLPFFVLITRIDSPTYAICKNMIRDAIETEKHGLWGRAYIDIANKFPQGDQWLEEIAALHNSRGIPTVTDRFSETLPTNYPMNDAAIYYGWYERNVNGPFLKTNFLFRPGAIAVHIHSFSAEQISNPHKNWAAPLLTRGATATLGNVHEPYLHLSHHLNIFHDRLLQGWSLAEAAWAATPACSWQTIVLGDPLYRPFIHFNGTGFKREQDRDFRAFAAACREWPDDLQTRREKLTAAAEKLSSGNLAEAVALDLLQSKQTADARVWFSKAESLFTEKSDKIRQHLHLAAIDRSQNKRDNAIRELRESIHKFGSTSESKALTEWLDLLLSPPKRR